MFTGVSCKQSYRVGAQFVRDLEGHPFLSDCGENHKYDSGMATEETKCVGLFSLGQLVMTVCR